jgi:hypothetical protein
MKKNVKLHMLIIVCLFALNATAGKNFYGLTEDQVQQYCGEIWGSRIEKIEQYLSDAEAWLDSNARNRRQAKPKIKRYKAALKGLKNAYSYCLTGDVGGANGRFHDEMIEADTIITEKNS